MGLLPATARLLAELHRDVGIEGPALTLGNQDVYFDLPGLRALFREVGSPWREPREVLPHTSLLFEQMYPQRARHFVHARTLFSMLGIEDYDDLDLYDFDRPTIVADLNRPVGEELRGRFGLVIDGGTAEHIFDLRTCLGNIVRMTRPGGRVVHWNSASHMVDHGFWAINPSAYFDFYSANGFDQLQATIFEWDTRDPWRPCPAFDYEYGMVINGLTDPERVAMVWFTARKLTDLAPEVPTQGLYRTDRDVPFSGGILAPAGTPTPAKRQL